MPLYEYECESCGWRFELIQKFSDQLASECPTCGGPVHKLLSSPTIQFKGSGWYVTDYAQKGKADTATARDGSGDASKSSASGSPDDGKDAGSSSSGSAKTSTGSAKTSTPADSSSK